MTLPGGEGLSSDRWARSCGFPVRPHMMRHTAATNWIRAGVDLDVVRALLGHVSLASTTVSPPCFQTRTAAGRSRTVVPREDLAMSSPGHYRLVAAQHEHVGPEQPSRLGVAEKPMSIS